MELMKLKNTFQMSQFFIAILRYLEAEMDYRLLLLSYRLVSQDYARKISSQFDQNWRRYGDFCDFPYDYIISVGITLGAKGPPVGPEGHPAGL